jgi:hypothetical protein
MSRHVAIGAALSVLLLLALAGSAASGAADTRAVYAGRTSQGHPLMATIAGGRFVAFSGQVDVRCDSGRTINIDIYSRATRAMPGLRIGRDGSFGETGAVRGNSNTGEQLGFVSVSKGKVGRDSTTGTNHVSGPVTDANGNTTDHCDSGLVKWTLVRGPMYGGDLDIPAHGPLAIRLARDGKSIRSLLVAFLIHCDNGKDYRFTIEHLDLPVGHSGRFSKRGMTGTPLRGSDDSTVSGHYELKGSLGPHSASGTYRATGVAQQGGVNANCDTGTMHWTAERG